MTPSPRSSVEATPQSPTSPFLHNLHQRLRKGSNASRVSSISSEAIQSVHDANAIQDTRSPKQYLASVVRDDWEYPEEVADTASVNRTPVNYRMRDESASEYESNGSKESQSHGEDPYKFDNPDDVGAVIERRRARRRRLLEQEMTWNDGLRVWTLRRDAWVGAVITRPRSTDQNKSSAELGSGTSNQQGRNSKPSDTMLNGNGSATEGTSHNDEAEEMKDGPYLPIYPPLFSSSHALRSRIKPSAYPALYSKVVIQGLTPNIPIPLNHMIGALVSGWKAEGNWPPQPTAESIAARRKSRKGESAFQKWKKEQDAKRSAGLTGHSHLAEADTSEHRGVRKSITGVVKKAFGRKDPEEVEVEQDLETLGLTFESENQQDEDLEGALANGHV